MNKKQILTVVTVIIVVLIVALITTRLLGLWPAWAIHYELVIKNTVRR
jgi:xanthine/uracil/vitamin C permease (AzgA family)